MRRWQVGVLGVLSALALACEGTARPSGGRDPDPAPTPRDGLPAALAALGDSITAGYASCATLVACRRNSWATGTSTDVDSHYRQIHAERPTVTAKNFAVPGVRADALAGQADRAVRAGVGYVTILIGANDACRDRVEDMTSVATFRRNVDAGLERLHDGLPRARILVASIPDVHRVWEVGHEDANAVRAWARGVCPSMLANPTSTAAADDERRDRVDERIDDYNRELSDACRDYDGACRYDGGVHRMDFTLDMLSRLDYFHPNVKGQDRLAEETFPSRFTW